LWQDDTWQTPHRPGFRLSLMKKTSRRLIFALIMELLPSAALAYNRSNDLIISINQKLQELTAFEPQILNGQSLSTLISLRLDTNPTGKETRSVQLKTAGGRKIQANLQIRSLSQTNQIVALIFTPPAYQDETQVQQVGFALVESLLKIQSQDSTTAALNAAAETCTTY
jgi:hypothetical protein